MNEHEPRPVSPEEELELSAAIRGLAELRLDPGPRSELKRRFVEGDFPPQRARPRARRWRWALAAAAVIAALLLVRMDQRGGSWSLVSSEGDASLLVDGRVVPLDQPDELGRALQGGGEIRVEGDAPILVAMSEVLHLELTPGLEATLPPPARRWSASAVELEVHAGELRVATGPRLPRAGLKVSTVDGTVLVTGTIFSVVCNEGGTCVCVLEGKIRVGYGAEDMDAIPAGMRKVLFRDGKEALISPSAPPHREGLEEFKARMEASATPSSSH